MPSDGQWHSVEHHTSEAVKPTVFQTLDKYGVDYLALDSNFYAAVDHAKTSLNKGRPESFNKGDEALISLEDGSLKARFVMMGNLLPKTIAIRHPGKGKHNSDDERCWFVTLERFWLALAARDRRKFKAQGFAAELHKWAWSAMKGVEIADSDGRHYIDREHASTLVQYKDPSYKDAISCDLELLMQYVAQCCVNAQRDWRAEGERKKEDKTKASRRGQKQGTLKIWPFGKSAGR